MAIGPTLPAPTVDSCDSSGTAAELFLCAHNEIRAEAPSATPPLNPVNWNVVLAAEAQRWADLCSFEHDPARGPVGENLFQTSISLDVEIAAVQAWASERPFYNELTGACEDGAICGHYTQIVSRNVTEIGCGVASCPATTFGTLAVCRYSPAPQGIFLGSIAY